MDLLSPNWTSLWWGFNNTPSYYFYLTYFLDYIIFIVFFIIIIILQKLSNVLQSLFTQTYYNPCLQYRNKIKSIFFLGNITKFENFVRGLWDILKSIKHCDKYDANPISSHSQLWFTFRAKIRSKYLPQRHASSGCLSSSVKSSG